MRSDFSLKGAKGGSTGFNVTIWNNMAGTVEEISRPGSTLSDNTQEYKQYWLLVITTEPKQHGRRRQDLRGDGRLWLHRETPSGNACRKGC